MKRYVKLFPIYALFISTFGLASLAKFSAGGVPEWFVKQFSGTILTLFPGALGLMFFGLAVLEALVTLIFIASFLRREGVSNGPRPLLDCGFWLAQMAFVALGFGQRLTGDFAGAAQLFAYFGVSLVAQIYVRNFA